MVKVCLDAGHNITGADTGAVGNGLTESILTLDICQRIKVLLEFNGFEVVMTRTGDFVNGRHGTEEESLQTRCDIANDNNCDIFISVHINSGGGYGFEVYCFIGGQAEILAETLRYYMKQQTGLNDRGVKSTGNFKVLRDTKMPAILSENGFIDNVSDVLKLSQPEFRQKIAIAHVKAVCDYFKVDYREENSGIKTKSGNKAIIGKINYKMKEIENLLKEIS